MTESASTPTPRNHRAPGGALVSRRPSAVISAIASALSLAATACETTQGVAASGQALSDTTAPQNFPLELQPFHRADDILRLFDTDGDGRADVQKAFRPAEEPEGAPQGAEPKPGRLVRKELDLNHDGRMDMWRYYDANGEQFMDAYDFDFDGHVDQVNFYEHGAVVQKAKDLDGDGVSDSWTYLENGKVVRKERDANGDGKVDYWEFWEDGAVVRIGIDLDADGDVDRWSRAVSDDEKDGQ